MRIAQDESIDRRDGALRKFAQCRYGQVCGPPSATGRLDSNLRTRQESELGVNIRKATSIDETAPKRTSAASEIIPSKLILV